jgi:5-methylcytosine-specific restriction endonuclease McrA
MKPSNTDLSKSTNAILIKFKHKCLICRRPTGTIHEILPRSVNRNWMEESNRVPLCTECHEKVHNTGAVKNAPMLRDLRDQRLQEYYGTTIE